MLNEILTCCVILMVILCYKAIKDATDETRKNIESLEQEIKDLKNVLNNILTEDDWLILE